MKKYFLPVIVFLVLSLTPAFSQGWEQPKPQISVSGSAEVKVVPDEIYLTVGVETRDEDLQKAKKQNDDVVAAALAFLKKTR